MEVIHPTYLMLPYFISITISPYKVGNTYLPLHSNGKSVRAPALSISYLTSILSISCGNHPEVSLLPSSPASSISYLEAEVNDIAFLCSLQHTGLRPLEV